VINLVSLTGPDDKTSIDQLARISEAYPFVEWGVLYVPNYNGTKRNPSEQWRKDFFDSAMPGSKATHLCGAKAFYQLLDNELPAEILKSNRIQLNINARKVEFSDQEVKEVYARALDVVPAVILQLHSSTQNVIRDFLKSVSSSDRSRIHVLLDESRGKGKMPSHWTLPAFLADIPCGIAGGLNPTNIAEVLSRFEASSNVRWVDMESGIRTDNEFDLDKAISVLESSKSFVR
jgi:phosphoribosylanthranilate isomerase